MNTKTTLSRFDFRTTTRAAAMLLAIACTTATAGQPSEIHGGTGSATVSLAGLDLSTPEGKAAAHDRVKMAARRLCFKLSDFDDLSRQSNYVACVDDAVATAMLKITERVPALVAQSLAGGRNVR